MLFDYVQRIFISIVTQLANETNTFAKSRFNQSFATFSPWFRCFK